MIIDAADTDIQIQAAAISHDVPGVICIKKGSNCFSRSAEACRQMYYPIPCHMAVMQIAAFMVMVNRPPTSFKLRGEPSFKRRRLKGPHISYVTRFIYGDRHSSSLDIAQAAKWKGRKNTFKPLMRLSPDLDSLKQHIL